MIVRERTVEEGVALTRRWWAAIEHENLLTEDAALLQERLAMMADDFLRLLDDTGLPASGAREIGAALVPFAWDRPRLLSATMEVLSSTIESLPPAAQVAAMPRLAALLGEFCQGFYARQGAEVARRNVDHLRSVGHELAAPLSAIAGFARLLLRGFDGPLNETQSEDIAAINEAVEEMLALLRATIDVGKGEAGLSRPAPEPCDLSLIIEKAAYSARAPFGRRGTLVEVDWDSLPERVECDPALVERMLLSLLAFAAWTAPEETLTVSAEQTKDALHLRVGPVPLTPERLHALLNGIAAATGPVRGGSSDIQLLHAAFLAHRLGGSLTVEPVGESSAFLVTLPAG